MFLKAKLNLVTFLLSSYSFFENVPILLIQRVDGRRVKKLESQFVGISRTNDRIPEAKVCHWEQKS